MSKGQRWPLLEAQNFATHVVEELNPLCLRIEVAGSIRRQRPDVGDIDLVVQLQPGNPWAVTQLEAKLAGLGYAIESSGQSILRARMADDSAPGVDVYYANERSWGITLMIRTGSAAHNIKMARHAQKANLPTRSLTLAGIVNTTKAVVASDTEEDCFKAIGLGYIEPVDREAPELEDEVRS